MTEKPPRKKRVGRPHTAEAKLKMSLAKKGVKRGHYKDTNFETDWGIHAGDLAKQEGITTTAIHMRVMLYGTPFQRRKKPTKCERISGRTIAQWAKALNLHPATIDLRIKHHNCPAFEHPSGYGLGMKHVRKAEVHWTEKRSARAFNERPWLHPWHPNYEQFMSQFTHYNKYFEDEQ